MKNTTLTLSFNTEKLDALTFHMSKKDADLQVELNETIQKLYEKVENELSQREKLVLKMRYGLYGGEEYTQREVAKQLGISRSYVSRIEKSAVEKLRVFFCSS